MEDFDDNDDDGIDLNASMDMRYVLTGPNNDGS